MFFQLVFSRTENAVPFIDNKDKWNLTVLINVI